MTEKASVRVWVAAGAMYAGMGLPWVLVAVTTLVAYWNAGPLVALVTAGVASNEHWLEYKYATPLIYGTAPAWVHALKFPVAELFWLVRFSIARGTPINAYVGAVVGYLVLGHALNALWGRILAGKG